MTTPALERFDQAAQDYASTLLKFRATMTALEWAETERRMGNGGRYRTSFAPYQREMIETPFRPEVQMTVFMIASRMGKSEVCKNIIGHGLIEAPRKILCLWPTEKHATLESKEGLDTELFQPTPSLRHMARGSGRRDSSNTLLHKQVPGGGRITLFGANAGGDLARAKGDLAIADEADKYEATKGDEGDQLKILWMRTSEYPNAIRIACSYPSIKGQSRIADLMEASDYRKFFTPCSHCGELFVMLREHIKHPDGEPEKAEIEAPCCSRMITDEQRRAMIHDPRAEWQATRPFNGTAGFWGNGMLSPHPVQKGYVSHLHWIAQEAIDAEAADNPDRARQVIVTKFDAVPFQPERIDAPDPDGLIARCERYDARDMLPDGVIMITVGADVQDNRIEASVWGWGLNRESWFLEHETIAGNVDDPDTWAKFDQYLANLTFAHPLSTKETPIELSPLRVLIDSGHEPTEVYGFTRPRRLRRIYSCHGSPTINAQLIEKKMKTIKGTAKKVLDYAVGVNGAKDTLYRRLTIGKPVRGEDPAVGYVHFPKSAPPSYFAGLTCEYGVEEVFRGEVFTRYKNPPGKRNEPLDCFVYAYAATKLVLTPVERLRSEMEAKVKV